MPAIQLKGAASWVDKLGKDMHAAALRGLLSAANRGVGTIVSVIIPSRSPQPVDRGLYKAGWRAHRDPNGASIENNEPHAPFVEYGVRGANVAIGRAMITALAGWVARKRLARSGPEAISAAWAIAKSMKARGIFRGGRGMRILDELRARYLATFIREEVAREIKRL
jgi:hypothetical protein